MKNKNKIITIYFLEKLKFAGLVKLKTLHTSNQIRGNYISIDYELFMDGEDVNCKF